MSLFSKNHTEYVPHWLLSIKQGWKSSIFSQSLVAQAFYNLDRSKIIEQFLKQNWRLYWILMKIKIHNFKNTYCLAFLGLVSSFEREDNWITWHPCSCQEQNYFQYYDYEESACIFFQLLVACFFLSFHYSICRQSFQHDILIYGGRWRWFPQCL